MNSYKDLIVWQKAVDLCVDIYELTKSFPKSEVYGLSSQIQRCAVSVPSNIAEGQKRGSKTEYIHFLRISYGSGAELETQLIIAQKIGYMSKIMYDKLTQEIDEIMRMLNVLIKRLNIN